MIEKQEVEKEKWERFAVIDKTLQYVAYPFTKHVNSALAKNTLYMEDMSWRKFAPCNC